MFPTRKQQLDTLKGERLLYEKRRFGSTISSQVLKIQRDYPSISKTFTFSVAYTPRHIITPILVLPMKTIPVNVSISADDIHFRLTLDSVRYRTEKLTSNIFSNSASLQLQLHHFHHCKLLFTNWMYR